MTPRELSYALWRWILNRPVDQATTDQIFWYAATFCEEHPQDESGIDYGLYAKQALANLPPTNAEIAPVAYDAWWKFMDGDTLPGFAWIPGGDTRPSSFEFWNYGAGLVWRNNNARVWARE